MDACARADRAGFFTCPHTGVALAGLEALVKDGTIAQDESVVVVSTAHGLKFTETKVGYHEGALPGISSTFANPPRPLEATFEAVMEALESRFSS